MTGWEKCEELKKIRKQVADANGIPYEIENCEQLEDCIGTCPKCDAEINFLSEEIAKKQAAGEDVILDGIAGNMFQGDGTVESITTIKEPKEPRFSETRGLVLPKFDDADGGISALENISEGDDGGVGFLDDIIDETLPFN